MGLYEKIVCKHLCTSNFVTYREVSCGNIQIDKESWFCLFLNHQVNFHQENSLHEFKYLGLIIDSQLNSKKHTLIFQKT
uniref:Uncharacterized protein n=1 Tax=Anguilla anguilla TaxID=7936 RepID=A0A0E9V0L4_ANGAN